MEIEQVPVRILEQRLMADARVDRLAEEADAARLERRARRGHVVERVPRVTVIALGEATVLTGATTAALDRDTPRVSAFVSAFIGSVTLWWLYFNYVATIISHHLAEAKEMIRMAKSVFVYGHFPVIAGIVLTAVGDELIIAHPTHHLETAALMAVIAGPVIYLLSFVAIRYSVVKSWACRRLIGAAACVAVGVIAEFMHPQAVLVGLVIVAIFITVIPVSYTHLTLPTIYSV